MKKIVICILMAVCIMSFAGCNNKSMDYIIDNEPSITGTVKEVHDNYIIIYFETDGYPNGADCEVPLNVENKDSMTHFNVGDEVIVYYDGNILETYPLRLNTVYAITLKTPADRSENNKP